MPELPLGGAGVAGLLDEWTPIAWRAECGVRPFTRAERQTSFQSRLMSEGVRRPRLLTTVSAGRKSAGDWGNISPSSPRSSRR